MAWITPGLIRVFNQPDVILARMPAQHGVSLGVRHLTLAVLASRPICGDFPAMAQRHDEYWLPVNMAFAGAAVYCGSRPLPLCCKQAATRGDCGVLRERNAVPAGCGATCMDSIGGAAVAPARACRHLRASR